MKKPVSLTLHKSQIERREKKLLRSEFAKSTHELLSKEDVVAYAVVAFGRNGEAFALWDTGKVMPKWAFPGAIQRVLDFDTSTIEDDYKAPLHRTGWPK